MAKLSAEDYEYRRRTESSVSSVNYHFVFVPKRRKAVLVKDVARRLQEMIFDLVTEHGWKREQLTVNKQLTIDNCSLITKLTTSGENFLNLKSFLLFGFLVIS